MRGQRDTHRTGVLSTDPCRSRRDEVDPDHRYSLWRSRPDGTRRRAGATGGQRDRFPPRVFPSELSPKKLQFLKEEDPPARRARGPVIRTILGRLLGMKLMKEAAPGPPRRTPTP